MIRERYRRRPSVESLESMVLLSGLSAATRHAAPALLTKLPAASSVTNVSGTVEGKMTYGPGPVYVNSYKGTGAVSPLGHATVKGSYAVSVSGSTYQATGTFTLTTSKGNIVVDTFKSAKVNSGNGPTSMTVTKGTKHFKGIVGSGSGSFLTLSPPGLHGRKVSGTFSLTVNLNVTIPTS
jgi:hypothetical protein